MHYKTETRRHENRDPSHRPRRRKRPFDGGSRWKRRHHRPLHDAQTESEMQLAWQRQPSTGPESSLTHPRMREELIQPRVRRKKIQLKKWAEDLDRPLPEEDTQVAKRPTKRCSASPVVRETQMETAVRSRCTPTDSVRDRGEGAAPGRGVLTHTAGAVNWCRRCGKQHGGSPKN